MGTHNNTTNQSYIQKLQSTMNFNTNHYTNDSAAPKRTTTLAVSMLPGLLAAVGITNNNDNNQGVFQTSVSTCLGTSAPVAASTWKDTASKAAKVVACVSIPLFMLNYWLNVV